MAALKNETRLLVTRQNDGDTQTYTTDEYGGGSSKTLKVEDSARTDDGVYFSGDWESAYLNPDQALQLAADIGARSGFSLVRTGRYRYDDPGSMTTLTPMTPKESEGDGSHVVAGHRIRTDSDAVDAVRIVVEALLARDATERAAEERYDPARIESLARLLSSTMSLTQSERAKRILDLLADETPSDGPKIGEVLYSYDSSRTFPVGTILADRDGDLVAVGKDGCARVTKSNGFVRFDGTTPGLAKYFMFAPLTVVGYLPGAGEIGAARISFSV